MCRRQLVAGSPQLSRILGSSDQGVPIYSLTLRLTGTEMESAG